MARPPRGSRLTEPRRKPLSRLATAETPAQAFTGCSPKRHPNAVWRRSASPSLRFEAARTSPASRAGIQAACPTEDLPSRKRTFPADAQGAREAHAHSAGEPTRRHGGTRHRGARLPRARRRRPARDQLDLPGRRAQGRAARRGGAAARRDLHGLVVDRRPGRGGSDGGGVAGAAATSPCCASRAPSTRPRTRFARSRSCARSRAPRRSCSSARSGTSRACASSSAGSTAATATRTRYRYVVRPLPSLPLVRHELRRSRAWRETGGGRCACSTRPTRLRAPRASARLRSGSWGATTIGGDGPVVLSPRRIGARRRVPLARARRAGLARRRSPAARWAPTGALGNAQTFFAGIETVPGRLRRRGRALGARAATRWMRRFPMHPSYEEREGAPDRVVHAGVARAGRAHGRRVVAR